MVTRNELIMEAAKKAAFYRDGDGTFFRMNFVDDECFNVLNDDTGETHDVYPVDVAQTATFFELREIEIPKGVEE